MKKTTKKVVSLLTILSFLLTLVPAAVFAADPVEADVQTSVVTVDGDKEAKVGDTVTAKVTLLGKDAVTLATTAGAATNLTVWAEEVGRSDAISNALLAVKNPTNKDLAVADGKATVDLSTVDPFKGELKVDLKFARPGTYVIKAALTKDAFVDPKTADKNNEQLKVTENKVVIASEDAEADKVKVKAGAFEEDIADGKTSEEAVDVIGNGVEPTEVAVTVYKDYENGTGIGNNQEVKFETNSANLVLDKTSAKTGYDSTAKVNLTSTVNGTYKLYVIVGDKQYTVKVKVGSQEAQVIETLSAPQNAIATVESFDKVDNMKDHFRFIFKDINGNLTTAVADQKAFKDAAKDRENHIKLLDKPSAAKVEGKDFQLKLVEDKDYATLVTDKKLAEGKYSLKVFLNNGRSVVVNFEVAKFGTAKELKLDYGVETIELNSRAAAPDITFVDENKVEKSASNRVTLGYNGYAVVSNAADEANYDKQTKKWNLHKFIKDGNEKGSFWVKDNEKYLGSKILVTAVAEREGLVAKADLTVAQDGRSIKFLNNKGVVGANNKVNFQLVDGAGKTVTFGGDYSASAVVIEKLSDDTAKVSASVTGTADLKEKGLGTLTLTSDKPVTADFAVYVRNTNGVYYAGNFTYTFGKDASNVGRAVVMTIGSKDVIVDNNVVAIDTAAIIKNDRTFVPFRALAEAFGAKVDWNEKDRTVTTEMDGKKVVMTIDKKEYKVNDKEMTMDVAPYIANDRTMVPVRFVAEALGFTVTPTYNTDGTTASVVFIK